MASMPFPSRIIAALTVCLSSLIVPQGSAETVEEPILIQEFRCFDQKDNDVAEKGGGPDGAHWNSNSLHCTATIKVEPYDVYRYLAVQMTFGQLPHQQRLIGLSHIGVIRETDGAAHFAAFPADFVRAGKNQIKRTFAVPQPVFEGELKKPTKLHGTFPVTLILKVTGYDSLGKPTEKTSEIHTQFAFGE